ncbi:MAG: hypothetical protein GY750_00485 [Lentisphaerae bacterium]|nr:hypothetical protein [Lentisphaerota bacterium]MCP4099897.1 hypothetical protein [Lentisphaerota bacterium]
MAWDGKRFDIPFIYLKYNTVEETKVSNAYIPEDDVAALINGETRSEDLVQRLAEKDMLKEACDFMSYSVNPRVGVWWAYNCITNLKQELEEAQKANPLPPEEQFKKDIEAKLNDLSDTKSLDALRKKQEAEAASIVADFEKIAGDKITDPNDPLKAVQQKMKALNDSDLAGPKNVINEFETAINAFPPAEVAASRARLDKIYSNYEKTNGINPLAKVRQIIERELNPEPISKDTSLMDQYYDGIKNRINDLEKFINQTASQHFPLKISGLPKAKPTGNADDPLSAVKRWILTPVDTNGVICRDAAMPKTQEPEGLCALAAYWSNSNLTPEASHVVHPPPGLSAQGISKTLYRCAMQSGGTKTYEERYEEYLNIGIDCITGILTWDKLWRPAKTPKIDTSDNINVRQGFGRESEIPANNLYM